MKHIIQNLKSAFNDNPWYGVSFMEIINQIPYDCVNRIPPNGSNSIVDLISHIIAWRIFVIEKIEGNAGYDIILNTPEDWPVRDIDTQEDWSSLIDELRGTQDKLIRLLESLPVTYDLDKLVPGKESDPVYNHHYMFSGIVQHDTYHLGQIALTWKLLR